MTRKTNRVGAIASASLLTATFAAAQATGAFAQNPADAAEVPEPLVEEAPARDADAPTFTVRDEGVETPEITFVSEEVVQDVDQVEEPVTITGIAPNDAASLSEMVARVMPVNGEFSRQMKCLAQAVYFESRGEPLAGQLAVARVVINRADSTVFPDDYCSVVTQRAQFSFVKGGRIPAPRVNSTAWKRARAIARIAHDELWASEAQDSLYFHANYVKPRWARHKTARATIKTHIFYR